MYTARLIVPRSVRITKGTSAPSTSTTAASAGGVVGSGRSCTRPAASTYCQVTFVGAAHTSSGVDGASPNDSVVQA